ncbi:MAG: GTP-binding protein [Paludibacteraceae bacterium]|nr:GTP-binding protein [Paludibacteraceae bacterium]
MNENYIPVLLLTGYLGSGKTTLLNRILTNRRGIRFAVIVNDIGEVNIDAELIRMGGVVAQQDDNLVALQNGCICCSLKMDLVQQLHDLCAATDAGNRYPEANGSVVESKPAFDYIVIEASGICEPAPIAQTICSYPQMVPATSSTLQGGLRGASIPKLDAIVTVVDALRMRDEFVEQLSPMTNSQLPIAKAEDLASLVIEQIEFCNLILLNKVSEVSEEEREHIRAILRAIQPKAKIIDCDYCDVPFGEILDTNLFDFESVATSATWIQKVEENLPPTPPYREGSDEHHHGHEATGHQSLEDHHHDHHHECDDPHCHCHDHHHECDDPHCHCHNHGDEYGITTFVYYRRQPFDLNRFDEFVARHWDKGIIRCKGMCYFEEEYDMCYLFEQAGKQFNLKQAGSFYATMPEEELMQLMARDPMLQRDWDEQYGDRMQKLVFIGQNINREAITKALDNCLI